MAICGKNITSLVKVKDTTKHPIAIQANCVT